MKPACLIALALSLACAAEKKPDTLVALNRTAVVTSRDLQAQPGEPAYRVPEAVLRDPGERLMVMAQLRRQIADHTRRLDDAAFRAERPKIAEQLRQAGLSPDDAEAILGDVEKSRGAQM
jgi:hypothetical protein